MEGASDKLFCCRWMRHRVPLAHREELYHILRMTGPLLLSRILNYLLPFVITMFCGRLGNEVMAGYGLASATINVTTVATGCGLALACNTFMSQTFGGKNLLRVGLILQRSIIILLLFCLPCWGLLINAEAILLCMGQDPEVTRIAQLYITGFLPAVPAIFVHQLLVSYLQNQGIILPQMYTAAMANIANVVTNYVFLYWLDLGVWGSAAANTLSQIYICTFLFAYIRWKKLHVKTWGGWSVESLQEWGSYMKLAIPSTFMKCFEWWIYEFGGFFAGMLSEDELAAQHAVSLMTLITYTFPLGVQAATCARVGNALGAGDTAGAILTCKIALALAGSIAVAEGLVLGATKTVIGFIFTSDEKIIGLVSHLMTAYCFIQFTDAISGVCTGIFLGTGRQRIPAVANLIGYYGIGLSLSVTLTFVAKLRILGFWLGLLVCGIFLSIFYVIVISKLNWERMTEEAVNRAQRKTPMTFISTAAPLDAAGDNTVDQRASNGNSADGYMSVSTECRDGNTETQGGHVVQQLMGGHLSTTQLILRRGFIAFAAVALLAVGASVHFLVPLPETRPSEANFTLDWINTTYTPDQIFSTALVPNEESD
ncbi:multidrug and toxin extrusion protein 1-like [Sebastes umbrosus]|uniref:multidrug and toxin extrusion protein 1-like n=1 Tax=Sebastes umbrosus TaxID=72105 RepID=UPI00189DB14B|nr:multidrug and toxin extrusion protein 1-like [Sebastes umbrosus]XP_037631744.1 multidrug and toxin extrusion protein 1-like [Sebastes umbrosus]XP_037631745.1 multidrug and toxin extrusion protein 1-like [Sebastes umbrosus]XP_037631746.1 multidrug and toxin extrusion protein 1-like [Sebastes umbrosus]